MVRPVSVQEKTLETIEPVTVDDLLPKIKP
jgi:hypothetical protein